MFYILLIFDILLVPAAVILSVVLLATTAEQFKPWHPMRSLPRLLLSFTPIPLLALLNGVVALVGEGFALDNIADLADEGVLSLIGLISWFFLIVVVVAQTVTVAIFLVFWGGTPLGSRRRGPREQVNGVADPHEIACADRDLKPPPG